MNPRLRELAALARGSKDTLSRNLASNFLPTRYNYNNAEVLYNMERSQLCHAVQYSAVAVTPWGLPKVSLKPTVTVSEDFQYKEVLFREQKSTVADCHSNRCHYNRRPLYCFPNCRTVQYARGMVYKGHHEVSILVAPLSPLKYHCCAPKVAPILKHVYLTM